MYPIINLKASATQSPIEAIDLNLISRSSALDIWLIDDISCRNETVIGRSFYFLLDKIIIIIQTAATFFSLVKHVHPPPPLSHYRHTELLQEVLLSFEVV